MNTLAFLLNLYICPSHSYFCSLLSIENYRKKIQIEIIIQLEQILQKCLIELLCVCERDKI